MSQKKLPGRGSSIHNPFPVSLASSARLGSGLITARLPDGSWSTPSALMTGGVGFGGLMGLELTDFVFVLTSDEAVRSLARYGSLTLGGNVSVAAGPVGRTAEATGTTSKRGVAGMLSYSKTRGLYAGVSLEGGLLIERADANKKMYGRKVSAKELLRGDISPPPEAASLMRALDSPCFSPESPVMSPVEPALELPSNDIQERVELSSERPSEPPQGIPELDARVSSQRAELGTGPPHEILELSSDGSQGTYYELDSAVSPSQFLTQTSKSSLPLVSPLSPSDIRGTTQVATGA
ncbi:unnamed protein product [Penicillium glandicola]